MECDDARFYLRFRRERPGELDADAAAALERHLTACSGCAAAAERVAAFDAAVGVAMRDVPVPDGLRLRLVAAVERQRQATVRRRVIRAAAVAASLLLAVGAAVGVFSAIRPQPGVAELVMKGDTLAEVLQPLPAQVFANDPLTRMNAEAVRRWLADERLPSALPEPFDYGLMVFHGTESVQGRNVPVVLFRDRAGTGFAKVYAFRSAQFDLKGIRDEQSSFCQSRAYPDRASGVTFVVVFTGAELTPFLRTPSDAV